MMSEILMLMLMMTCMKSASSASPVKVSVFLLFYTSIMFFYMSRIQSSSWLPLVFYMLFMGGILIMFMILSAVSPNEKTKKESKSKKMVSMMMVVLPIATLIAANLQEIDQKMKYFMNSNSTMMFTILMITLYFFLFINVINSEKSPMRTY